MMIPPGQRGLEIKLGLGNKMKKILTSHVGSLPRSQEDVDFIFAR